jgi:hypothetical protein
MANANRDNNRVTVKLLENDDGSVGPWLADNATGYALLVITPLDAPTAIETYQNDKNRVHPILLEDDSDAATQPWLSNSVGGAWVTIT